jgi:hypothetical protein
VAGPRGRDRVAGRRGKRKRKEKVGRAGLEEEKGRLAEIKGRGGRGLKLFFKTFSTFKFKLFSKFNTTRNYLICDVTILSRIK